VTSSFVKSFSWFQGRDGHMHQHTEETHNKVVQNEFDTKQTRSKVVCQDGHCQEVVMVAQQPTMVQEPQIMPMNNRPFLSSNHVPPRLRAILDRLMPTQSRPEIVMERPGQPDLIIQPVGGARPMLGYPEQKPMVVIGFAPSATQSNNLHQVQPSATADAHWRQLKFITLGAAFFSLVAAYAAVMAILKCRRSDAREAARERPFRDLAEPLAPAPMTVVEKMQGPQVRTAAAVPMYLSRLYARANAKSESTLVRKYMSQLYMRIVG